MQKMIFSLLLIFFFDPGTSFFTSEINFHSAKISSPKKIERVSSGYDYQVLYNIEYAHMDSQSLQLDLYQPQGVKSATPILIWLHGGAFTSGDKSNAGKYAPMF